MTEPEGRGKRKNLQVVLLGTCLLLILIRDDFRLPRGLVTGQENINEVRNDCLGTSAKSLSLNSSISDLFSSSRIQTKIEPSSLGSDSSKAVWIQHQMRLQEEFQRIIHRNQHPPDCSRARIALTSRRPIQMDGFTLDFQTMGRYVQSGLATDRTFVVRNNYRNAYMPPGCQWPSVNVTHTTAWDCLFEPLSNCSETSIKAAENLQVNSTFKASLGIIKDEARFFHPQHYSGTRVVDVPNLKNHRHIDVIEYWERSMGRYWIRAQMVHYLWRPSVGLKTEMEKRLPPPTFFEKPYIGMHIRYSDNIGSFWRDFGRDATATRGLHHFMELAQEIRNETAIDTIYLATDSKMVLELLENTTRYKSSWSFHIQQDVIRANADQESQWLWFGRSRGASAAMIAADIEVLRRADYLVGSYQSNVYRLATELNTAYHVDKYPLYQDRFRTVDVPWYEDP